MKVELIDYTGIGMRDPARFAENILIFTKNTRVKMAAQGLEEINNWPEEKRYQEIEYIANTIPGSWEMVKYTFLMTNVTRGFTHQLVRTRAASYAQQTMQILDMGGFTYETGPSIEADPSMKKLYEGTMKFIDEIYSQLVGAGAKIDDARGLLPTNIHTNIIMSANLRTVVDFCRSRISPRNKGETRIVAEKMIEAILAVHPWATHFLNSDADQAAKELDEIISSLPMDDDVAGLKFKMLKLVDRMRRG